MTPHVAAQFFVDAILTEVVRDVADLAEKYRDVYQPIEDAVRAQQSVPAADLERLEQAVRDAAPDDHRAAVATTLNRLIDARDDDLTVKQQTAYLIGVAVGRALSPALARKVGAR